MEFTEGEGKREGEGLPNYGGTGVDPRAKEERCGMNPMAYTSAAVMAWT
jgi:hypothetical protein